MYPNLNKNSNENYEKIYFPSKIIKTDEKPNKKFLSGKVENLQNPEIGLPDRWKTTRKYWVLSSLFLLLLISGTGVCLTWFTNVFDSFVCSNLVLVNGTAAFDNWSKPPYNLRLKFYLFNYTNTQEFLLGNAKKLRVEQLGPYVYEEYLERVNQKHENGTISYQEKRHFKFLPHASKGKQYDFLTVPNVPLLSIAAKFRYHNFFARLAVYNFFKSVNAHAFVTIPAHKLIMGYEDDLYVFAKSVLKLQNEMPLEKFGLIAGKNGLQSDVFTINAGLDNIDRLGYLEGINGKSEIDNWIDHDCNSLNGSASFLFAPKVIREKQPVNVFNKDFCRKLPFVFEKEDRILNDQILSYRYTIPETLFNSPNRTSSNQCFCELDGGTCPLQGLFNLTSCILGAPLFLSHPHFYNGDPSLFKNIDGLNPDGVPHTSYVQIHPTLGYAMNGITRLQVSVQVLSSFGIYQLEKFENEMMLPLSWFEFGLEQEELSEDTIQMIYFSSLTVKTYEDILKYGSLIMTLILLLLLALRLKLKM